MAHACINRMGTHAALSRLKSRDDARIVRSIRRACREQTPYWYIHKQTYHRWFLRQLYQEAHNRGLEVPQFKWPKKG